MGATHWDVVVIGGINTDYLARGAALPAPGSTVQGDAFQVGPGGKGANHAVAAALATTTLGDQTGLPDRAAILALLARVGGATRVQEGSLEGAMAND